MWTKRQKTSAVIACRQAGITDEQRKMILSGPAFKNRAIFHGEVTSTSPTLGDKDYEQFMAFVEELSGGQIQGFTRGYWAAKAGDDYQRMRWAIKKLAGRMEEAGLLEPDGAGLRGWIYSRVAGHRTDRVDDLNAKELYCLMESLKAHGKRHGLDVEAAISGVGPAKLVEDGRGASRLTPQEAATLPF